MLSSFVIRITFLFVSISIITNRKKCVTKRNNVDTKCDNDGTRMYRRLGRMNHLS